MIRHESIDKMIPQANLLLFPRSHGTTRSSTVFQMNLYKYFMLPLHEPPRVIFLSILSENSAKLNTKRVSGKYQRNTGNLEGCFYVARDCKWDLRFIFLFTNPSFLLILPLWKEMAFRDTFSREAISLLVLPCLIRSAT